MVLLLARAGAWGEAVAPLSHAQQNAIVQQRGLELVVTSLVSLLPRRETELPQLRSTAENGSGKSLVRLMVTFQSPPEKADSPQAPPVTPFHGTVLGLPSFSLLPLVQLHQGEQNLPTASSPRVSGGSTEANPNLSGRQKRPFYSQQPVLFPSKQEGKHSRGVPESQSLFSFSLHP